MPATRCAAAGEALPSRRRQQPRNSLGSEAEDTPQEVPIGRPSKPTLKKRDRERARQVQQREKEARREQRKAEKASRPATATGGEDPDLAGMVWGPQAPLY